MLKRKIFLIGIPALLCAALAFIAYAKSYTYLHEIVHQHNGVYTQEIGRVGPKWQQIMEVLVGDCPRFDLPDYICLESENLSPPEINAIPNHKSLTYICLSSGLLTDDCVEHLANFPELDIFHIRSDKLTDVSLQHLKAMMRYRSSYLISSNLITGSGLKDYSKTKFKFIGIKSESFDHTIASRYKFPDQLETLSIQGPMPSEDDVSHYLNNTPKSCQLSFIINDSHAIDTSVRAMSDRINIRRPNPLLVRFCDCHFQNFD